MMALRWVVEAITVDLVAKMLRNVVQLKKVGQSENVVREEKQYEEWTDTIEMQNSTA